jgi:hypothetical protein
MGDSRGVNGVKHTMNDSSPRYTFISIPETASYPTGSLDFLAKLQEDGSRQVYHSVDNLSRQQESRVRLDVIVVGAGLGGLSAGIALARKGHGVRVIEQAPVLGEVCFASRRSMSSILSSHSR